MELNTVYGQVFVLDSHNNVLESGGFFEAIGDFHGAETVIAAGLERVFHACEYALFVVRNSRWLAVHRLGCMAYLAAEVLHDDLMAEAYAEYRELILEVTHGFERNAGRIRRSRAWRDYEQIRVEIGGDRFESVQAGIGAIDFCHAIALAEIIDEVVCERIEVVDEQNFSFCGSHSMVLHFALKVFSLF